VENRLSCLLLTYNAQTLFLQVDIDFVPSSELYSKLTSGILSSLETIPRAALVIPHWESLDCREPDVPANFSALQLSASKGRVRPFYTQAAQLISELDVQMRTPSSRECFDPLSKYFDGVYLTGYQRWYRESLAGLEGFFKINTPWRRSRSKSIVGEVSARSMFVECDQ